MISITEADFSAWISPILWPFLRILAVFTAAPVFSARGFPVRARIALAFFVALAAQASLENQQIIGLTDPGAFGAAFQQVVIGLAIGFSVRMVFAAVELAGEVVGFQMGLNFAAFFDLSSNSQSSAAGRFFGQITALLFVVLNGHLMVLATVIRSFERFPANGEPLISMAQMRLYEFGAEIFASGLWIALPMIGMLMFVNLGLGIISRVAPQMNIYAVGFPVTLSVGLVGIAATLPLLDQPLFRLMEMALDIFANTRPLN